MAGRLFSFVGGERGAWRVARTTAVVGETLPAVPRLEIVNAGITEPPPAWTASVRWLLRGVTSHERYVTRDERQRLVTRQSALGRPAAACAALIPIRKSEAWWGLTQEERREIFEAHSAHVQTGLSYLPAVARRLHHGRDLGEPFDFLTWFEYAPEESVDFEELVARLRASEEWKYVEREVDLRLVRDAAGG